MKLRTADFATGADFDLGDTWGVKREYTLDAFTVGNFADRESFVDAAAALGDDETSEDLDALFATFNHAAMDLDGITHIRIYDVCFELLLLDFLNDIHGGGCGKVFGDACDCCLPNARGEMASG